VKPLDPVSVSSWLAAAQVICGVVMLVIVRRSVRRARRVRLEKIDTIR
jgi:hypothetical protein